MQAYSLYNISSPVISLCLPIFLLILPFFLIKLQGYPLTWPQYSTYLQMVLRNHSLGQIFNIKSASWDKRVMIIISFIFYLLQVYFNFMSCIKFIKNMTNIHYTIFTVKDFLYNSIQSINKLNNNWSKYSTYQPFINKNKQISNKAHSIYLQLNKISTLKLSFNKVLDIGKAMRAFYMINLDGNNLEQITFDSAFDAFPMFSNDGKKIVFSSNRNNGGTRETNLFIADWIE